MYFLLLCNRQPRHFLKFQLKSLPSWILLLSRIKLKVRFYYGFKSHRLLFLKFLRDIDLELNKLTTQQVHTLMSKITSPPSRFSIRTKIYFLYLGILEKIITPVVFEVFSSFLS
uniref:Uncharacterized protein n=1 Tax=Cacopsylla melanoneura TaxID=428564 RepID=A0A8D8SF16_9HEMI